MEVLHLQHLDEDGSVLGDWSQPAVSVGAFTLLERCTDALDDRCVEVWWGDGATLRHSESASGRILQSIPMPGLVEQLSGSP